MILNELNQIYVDNIRKYRKLRKLSQADLSEKIGITEKYLSAIETGKKWGSFETLVSLANALEVEPYELLLPNSQSISYDTKRTRSLMKRLRTNVADLMDTLDDYLCE